MFDDLKARRTGRSAKESARLWAMLGAAVIFGALVFNSKACTPEPKVGPRPPTTKATGAPVAIPLDRAPLERLVATPADPKAFDAAALDYLITEIDKGAARRVPDRVLPVQDVVALDPSAAVGRLYETVGVVRSIDAEEYKSAANPAVDQLWGFALEGGGGARVVVVQSGRTTMPEGGRPREANRAGAAPEALAEGAEVRVRGYYLQRRTGSVGGVKSIDAPTPVLVAREYRIVRPLLTRIEHPGEADFSRTKDRSNADTRSLDEQPLFEILAWARRRGAAAIAADLRSGALPFKVWDQSRFLTWSRELESDRDQSLPDPRQMTLASRGKVFVTSGALLTQDHEDWDGVPRNSYGVEERWKYWIISDHYGNVPLLFDASFPLSDFENVPAPVGSPYPHVRVYGVFVKNYTFEPAKAHLRPDARPDITVPFFVALWMEPIVYETASLWQNPFFVIGFSLAVFIAGFLFVMIRMERRESAQMDAQRKRLRKHVVLPGSRAGAESAPPASSDAAGPAAPPAPPAPPAAPPPS